MVRLIVELHAVQGAWEVQELDWLGHVERSMNVEHSGPTRGSNSHCSQRPQTFEHAGIHLRGNLNYSTSIKPLIFPEQRVFSISHAHEGGHKEHGSFHCCELKL
jgi:hypothetical protein